MKDSNVNVQGSVSSQFERCHGNGQAYKTYKEIEHKFTDEFRKITFDLMVETYVRTQMDRKLIPDREYVNLKNVWRSVAEELGVLKSYPYILDGFPPAHPMAKDVAKEGKTRLGL